MFSGIWAGYSRDLLPFKGNQFSETVITWKTFLDPFFVMDGKDFVARLMLDLPQLPTVYTYRQFKRKGRMLFTYF